MKQVSSEVEVVSRHDFDLGIPVIGKLIEQLIIKKFFMEKTEKALLKALANEEIGGAALDVYRKEPLKDMELCNFKGNLILTPHIGAQTIETQIHAATKIAEKMSDFLKKL